MGGQAPRISDFLNELVTDTALLNQWNNRERRGDLLRDRGFSGAALGALQSGDLEQIRDLVQQELGGDTIVICYVR